MRVLTVNHWGRGGAWPDRRAALRDGIAELQPDLIAFQEAHKTEHDDTVADLVEPDFDVAHQSTGLLGDGNCAAIVSRWPIASVVEVDQQVTFRTCGFPATTLIAEVDVPAPVGRLLFVNHLPSWKPQLEHERELQTVAAVEKIEELVADRDAHVVLAGDLDAVPDAASIRFLRGLQSLGGASVCYRDAWESTHPGESGHTFTLRNPLLMADSEARQEQSRRIDYIFVRCNERGPTLPIAACSLVFDEPRNGAGQATTSAWSQTSRPTSAADRRSRPNGRRLPGAP